MKVPFKRFRFCLFFIPIHFYFWFTFWPDTLADLNRLDPHGNPDWPLNTQTILVHSECKTCHAGGAAKVTSSEKVCASCHNGSPHSGAPEHMGGKKPIQCLDCHYAHRSQASKLDPGLNALVAATRQSSFIRSRELEPKQQELFVKKSSLSRTRMLRKSCEDCHSWK